MRCLTECFSNHMMIYMYVFILQLKVFEWRKHGFWSHVIWRWFAKVIKETVNYVPRTKKWTPEITVHIVCVLFISYVYCSCRLCTVHIVCVLFILSVYCSYRLGTIHQTQTVLFIRRRRTVHRLLLFILLIRWKIYLSRSRHYF